MTIPRLNGMFGTAFAIYTLQMKQTQDKETTMKTHTQSIFELSAGIKDERLVARSLGNVTECISRLDRMDGTGTVVVKLETVKGLLMRLAENQK